GDALLRGTLSGAETESAWTRFRATGALPLGTPGRALYKTLAAHVDALTRVAVAARDGDRLPPEELDLTIDGVHITGVLRDVWPAGQIAVRYSRLGERHEVGPWIRHLARNASHAPAAASALIGRAAKGDDPATVWFMPVREPQRHLAELLQLFGLGQCAPLPLFRIASRVFASTVAEPDGTLAHALEAARDRFPKQGFGKGDCDDPYVEELYRDRDPFDPATPAMPCEISFTDTAHTGFVPMLSH